MTGEKQIDKVCFRGKNIHQPAKLRRASLNAVDKHHHGLTVPQAAQRFMLGVDSAGDRVQKGAHRRKTIHEKHLPEAEKSVRYMPIEYLKTARNASAIPLRSIHANPSKPLFFCQKYGILFTVYPALFQKEIQ